MVKCSLTTKTEEINMAGMKAAIRRGPKQFSLSPKAIAIVKELAYKTDMTMSRVVENLLLDEGKKKLTVRKGKK